MTQLRKKVLEELERRNYSQATARAYVGAIRNFAEYFHRSPDRLGIGHVRQYQVHLFEEKKLAPHTVMVQMCALRFLYLKVLRRPFRRDDLPLPKIPVRLPVVLSREEVGRLIEGAVNLRHRTILMTLYATGMRRAEICRLKLDDIDSARMMIHVREGKGRKDRDIPLSDTLLAQLRTWWRSLSDKSGPWLFPSDQQRLAGQPMSDKTVWHACRFAALRAGITKPIHPHTLRHSFATHLVESGADLYTVMRLLGHADLGDTEVYIHLSKRHLAAPTNPLDALQPVDRTTVGVSRIMSRPTLEVADIFRAYAASFVEHSRTRISWPQHKAIRAIERCRTAALGWHHDRCTRCGKDLGYSFNSCRNRHCPKCQVQVRNRWIHARTGDLIPVGYFHVVFTVPHLLSGLMLQNKRLLYDLLFRAAADTLMEVAANPKHLGAEIGFLAVLHTWGQTLNHHPHLHCVVPSGGFAPGRSRWVRPPHSRFFAPKEVLSIVFRGKFVEGLRQLYRRHKLAFHGQWTALKQPHAFAAFLQQLHRHRWVVHPKKPFGGPEHVLHYLGRYTHRVAISNHRLIAMENGKVTFRWKDYAHGGKKRKMTIAAEEFMRRFLLHVLPKGFVRIRHFGWMANRCRRERAQLARQLLGEERPIATTTMSTSAAPTEQAYFGRICPHCGGPVEVVEVVVPRHWRRRPSCRRREPDTS